MLLRPPIALPLCLSECKRGISLHPLVPARTAPPRQGAPPRRQRLSSLPLPPSAEGGGAPKGAPEGEMPPNKNSYFNTRYVVIQNEGAAGVKNLLR